MCRLQGCDLGRIDSQRAALNKGNSVQGAVRAASLVSRAIGRAVGSGLVPLRIGHSYYAGARRGPGPGAARELVYRPYIETIRE